MFVVGSLLAADPAKSKMKLPDILQSDIELLERGMDNMNEALPALKHFILPGGNQTASFCHIARCVCRRAERQVVHLAEQEIVDELLLIYLNRLSDYLFVLSRKVVYDAKNEENIWNPRA